ncbi:MAG: type II CRISPR-associated endonuclease Cas1 [Bacteroidales bacterium]|nr:type II CRISPR-associated endonuclease Cas1 [Bacteroidales bacterium]
MLRRTLYFGNPYFISTRNEQLLISSKETGEGNSIPIDDLGCIIFDHPQITFTQGVMQKLSEANVALVVCDAQHMPASMMLHLDTNTVQTELFGHQVRASEPLRKNLWKQTVSAKIGNQAALLELLGHDPGFLRSLATKVRSGDTSNAEATASRHYWPRLTGMKEFRRERYGMPPNPSLNYGYAILRAAVARALCSSGLLPTLGIHHHNKYNAFCLADDVMEPYRPFVDAEVRRQMDASADYHDLNKDRKAGLLRVLSADVAIGKVTRPLMVALSTTTASLAGCFEGSRKKIEYPHLPV